MQELATKFNILLLTKKYLEIKNPFCILQLSFKTGFDDFEGDIDIFTNPF